MEELGNGSADVVTKECRNGDAANALVLLKDVMSKHYIVRNYQRGYRWDKDNVTKLLEDIFEDYFALSDKSQKENLEKYWLQSLVVRKYKEAEGKYTYSVIDGQQRLTTLYIIFKVMEKRGFALKDGFLGTMEYESREGSKKFLEQIGGETMQEETVEFSIDAAFMLQTFQCVDKWFEEKKDKLSLADAFSILTEKTVFNWDEDEAGGTEQDAFSIRNRGKIELTDAELVKAMFMNPEYYGSLESDASSEKNVRIKERQIIISSMWENNENALHDEKFWEFLPLPDKRKKEYQNKTRMNAVFYLFLKRERQKEEYSELKKIVLDSENAEDRPLFAGMELYLKKRLEKQAKKQEDPVEVLRKCWREICDMLDGIRELFENPELYNLCSFLKFKASINQQNDFSDFELISEKADVVFHRYMDIVESSKWKSGRSFLAKLYLTGDLFGSGIRDILENELAPVMASEEKPEKKGEEVLKIFHGEVSKKIKGLRWNKDTENLVFLDLLVYNIMRMDQNGVFANKFDFQKLRNEKWQKEHIYSRKTDVSKESWETKEALLKYFAETEYHKEYIEYLFDIKIEDVMREVVGEVWKDEWKEDWGKLPEEILSVVFENAKSDGRYSQRHEIWRCLILKKKAQELLLPEKKGEWDQFFNPSYQEGNALDDEEEEAVWSRLVTDNSMGNMMLLSGELNIPFKNYSSWKKRGILLEKMEKEKKSFYMPMASMEFFLNLAKGQDGSEVLAERNGTLDFVQKKYDLAESKGYWLMKERKAYLEDIITTISSYLENIIETISK